MKKIKRRARQLKLLSKSKTISFDSMISLMRTEQILQEAPHTLLKAGEPLHRQDKEVITYISERVKFIPETLMEKADYVAMEAARRLELKNEHFNSKMMTLNHAFLAYKGSGLDSKVLSSWIPKLCGHGGTMCFQAIDSIEAIYKVASSTADTWQPINSTDNTEETA